MAPLDGVGQRRPPLQAKPPLSLKGKEMERIRRVFDEDSLGKKFASIASPREDAHMFRNTERHTMPCECIVELYELLWRWGHRGNEHAGFTKNFGFSIPDTIVIVKGKPYAWYFISKKDTAQSDQGGKDGSLLRKSEGNLQTSLIEKKLCHDRGDDEQQPCATWMPMASQFPEARCHSQTVEFMGVGRTRHLLSALKPTHSGIIQAFVEPHGISNFLVRTVQYMGQTSMCVRTNRSVLGKRDGSAFERCATFEGWEGLSSACSRYRSHRHPHMEELILEAGAMLSQQIERERVRDMLFLETSEHVALHFKVTREHMLYFVYASVISERDVILQTRPQLLMGDACMTEALPYQALLPGGADRQSTPHRPPACLRRYQEKLQARALPVERQEGHALRQSSVPPLPPLSGEGHSSQRRSLSARRSWQESTILPRLGYAFPEVPEGPFHVTAASVRPDPSGYVYVPPGCDHTTLKQPLVTASSALSARQPALRDMSCRSEQGSMSAR